MFDFQNLGGVGTRNILPPYLQALTYLPGIVIRREALYGQDNYAYVGIFDRTLDPGMYRVKLSLDFRGYPSPLTVFHPHMVFLNITNLDSNYGGTSSKAPTPYPRGFWFGTASQLMELDTNKTRWIAGGSYREAVGIALRAPIWSSHQDFFEYWSRSYAPGVWSGALGSNFVAPNVRSTVNTDAYYLIGCQHRLRLQIYARDFMLLFG